MNPAPPLAPTGRRPLATGEGSESRAPRNPSKSFRSNTPPQRGGGTTHQPCNLTTQKGACSAASSHAKSRKRTIPSPQRIVGMKDKTNELSNLQSLLQAGLALSKQRSYERRLPSAAALPKLREALRGLQALVQTQPTAEAWRSLALAEEVLLHYPAARAALQQAVALSQTPDRKDLKKLALLTEYAAKWELLGLTPTSLSELGNYLDSALKQEPCDHSLRHTQAWLDSRGTHSATELLESLRSAGGCCDCEVLWNVV